jgi:hypothetical protein
LVLEKKSVMMRFSFSVRRGGASVEYASAAAAKSLALNVSGE